MLSWSDHLEDDIRPPRWLAFIVCTVPVVAFAVLLT